MSLLDLSPYISLDYMRKLSLFNRIKLYTVNSRLGRLCFDRTVERKPMETISLNELHQLYENSGSEKEKNRCLDHVVVKRLRTKNLNEIIHLYMNPDNEEFFTNQNIQKFLKKGPLVLEGENDNFSAAFFEKFLDLLDKTEGDLLVALLYIKSFENLNADRFNNIITRKWKRGDKSYFILLSQHGDIFNSEFDAESWPLMEDMATVVYCHHLHSDGTKEHNIVISRRMTSLKASTEAMINIVNQDNRFEDCRQMLEKLLPLEFPSVCFDCRYHELQEVNYVHLSIHEPEWSICANCAPEKP